MIIPRCVEALLSNLSFMSESRTLYMARQSILFCAEAKDMRHQGTGKQEEQIETRLKLSSDVCLEYPTGHPQSGSRSAADEQKSTDRH